MPSPFPGMDPYLEAHWLDVYTSLISGARDALNRVLPDDLIASAEERLAVESERGEEHRFGPDVQVVESPADEAIVASPGSGGAVSAPYRILAQVEPITERFIRVVDARTEHLVTVIEFVSPTNKRGEGLAAFRSKRTALIASGVNFVEIDLVRAGDWRELFRPQRCARRMTSLYRVTSRVPQDPGAVYLHPVSLREPLPSIPIPLRAKDPETRLELQPLLDRAYANGRYERRLDYRRPLEPPLEGEDTAWTTQLLASAGRL